MAVKGEDDRETVDLGPRPAMVPSTPSDPGDLGPEDAIETQADVAAPSVVAERTRTLTPPEATPEPGVHGMPTQQLPRKKSTTDSHHTKYSQATSPAQAMRFEEIARTQIFLKVAIVPIILLLIVFAWWWARHKNDRKVREFLDPIKLKMPVFGNLNKKIALSRFSRNLSAMLGAGVPILQALDIVGEASGNTVVEEATKEVMDAVRKGRSITAPLQASPVFPPMMAQMMAVGEDTGALDDMLAKIGDFYDQEVESTTEQLTSLIEPLIAERLEQAEQVVAHRGGHVKLSADNRRRMHSYNVRRIRPID